MEYALVNVFGTVLDIYPTRSEAQEGNRKHWRGMLDVRAIWTREIWEGD